MLLRRMQNYMHRGFELEDIKNDFRNEFERVAPLHDAAFAAEQHPQMAPAEQIALADQRRLDVLADQQHVQAAQLWAASTPPAAATPDPDAMLLPTTPQPDQQQPSRRHKHIIASHPALAIQILEGDGQAHVADAEGEIFTE